MFELHVTVELHEEKAKRRYTNGPTFGYCIHRAITYAISVRAEFLYCQIQAPLSIALTAYKDSFRFLFQLLMRLLEFYPRTQPRLA